MRVSFPRVGSSGFTPSALYDWQEPLATLRFARQEHAHRVSVEAQVFADPNVWKAFGATRFSCTGVLVDPALADFKECCDLVDGEKRLQLRRRRLRSVLDWERRVVSHSVCA